MGELERRVGPLKRDSEKAQQFLELSGQRKSLEVTLWVDAIRRAKDTVRDQQRRYEAAQADYDRLSRSLDEYDEKSEALRAKTQQLMLQVEESNAQIRAITEENAGSDSRIAVLDNENEHSRRQIEEARAELSRAGEGQKGIELEAEAHRAAIEKLNARIAQADETAKDLDRQLDALEQQAMQSGQQRDLLNAAILRCQQAATAAQVQHATAESAANAAEARLQDARAQKQQNESDAETAGRQQAEAADRLKQAEEAVTRLDNVRAGLRLKLDSRKRQQAEAADALQKAERELSAAAQRIHILEDLERNLDGYQQSVKTVMRAAGSGRLRGVIGPVAGILTVRKGYEVAIETALGFALQNIVVEDEKSARAAIAFLKAEKGGRATFLPLDTMQGSRFSGRLTGTAEVAADLVEADPRYQNIVNNLLGRIIVVEDLAEASAVARNLGYRNRIVTLDGQVINAGGSFTGGSTARSVGVFSRKQELEELRARLTRLQTARDTAAQAARDRKAEADTLQAQLTGADSESMTAAADRLRASLEVDRLAAAADNAARERERLQQEIALFEAQLAESRAAAEQAGKDRAAAEAEQADAERQLAALGESADSLTAKREELTAAANDNRLARLTAEKDVSLHQAALETLAGRTGEAEARARELNASIEACRQRIRANELSVENIQRQREENRRRIADCEQAIRDANAARMQAEADSTRLAQENRALTDEREKMSGEMARLAERRTAAETELNSTAAKLWEEYQLAESEAEALCVEFQNVTELRRQVAEVRGKIRALGNVNVGAIDEYKEVKERYDFMKAQVTDVEKSRAELNRMIGELCDEMRTLFADSFKRINENFVHIFRELFGGGSARLYLSDPDDVLESGIEIEVSPPGKVIKNLSALSGGEQALVAISIYFAILAVNPSPFCILDEIEAALDDVNVVRYAQYLRRLTDKTQFIVITHRRGTMEAADVLYGVTMQEDGVSKILRLDLNSVSADLIS